MGNLTILRDFKYESNKEPIYYGAQEPINIGISK